jgi:hypothetical protein
MSFYGGIEETGRLTEDTMARRKLRPRDVPSLVRQTLRQ